MTKEERTTYRRTITQVWIISWAETTPRVLYIDDRHRSISHKTLLSITPEFAFRVRMYDVLLITIGPVVKSDQ